MIKSQRKRDNSVISFIGKRDCEVLHIATRRRRVL